MSDWDDLRFFLAVARHGSVTAAAARLGVNHSTVSRRISAYESKLGVRLLDRLPSGYALTAEGDDMLNTALKIESDFSALNRRLQARDSRMCGNLSITVPQLLVEPLLIPALASFQLQYPDVKVDLIISNDVLSLSRREADIALRVTDKPPENLIGRRLTRYATAIYASEAYLKRHVTSASRIRDARQHSWIGQHKETASYKWARKHYPSSEIVCTVNSKLARFDAVNAGIGMALLPCFLADSEKNLQRIYPRETRPESDIWILTHPDLRHTARVSAFTELLKNVFEDRRSLFEGAGR